MKNALYIIYFSLLTMGCKTPAELVQKALKKDPNIINCDSTILTKYIDTNKVIAFDSIVIDNNEIYLKIKSQGEINLDYKVKSQTIPVIVPHDTNVQTRQKERTARKRIKEENKTQRKEIKETEKTERNSSDNKVKEIRSNNRKEVKKSRKFSWLLLAYCLGIITVPTVKFIIKKVV